MVTKIFDGLYLGDWNDALSFDGEIICVMQEILSIEPKNAYWIPIIRTSGRLNNDELIDDQDVEVFALKHQLMLVTQIVNDNLEKKKDTLIHCMAGIERSPLAVVYCVRRFMNLGWDEAYDYVKDKRPEVANRLEWLNLTYEERLS